MRAARQSFAPVLAVIIAGVVALGATPIGARWPTEPAARAAGDTVVVYGPKRFETPTGQTTVGVESFTLSVQPNRQYLLRLANGNPDGSARASTGTVELNGKTVITVAELGGAYSATRAIQALPSDTLRVTLSGSAGASVDVSVLEISDPTFAVFGPRVLVRQTGQPRTETFSFSVPAAGGAPFYMSIRNGRSDGSHRTSSATVVLNGQQVLAPSELSQVVGGLTKVVTLQAENTIEATVLSVPTSEITVTFSATDIAPPILTIETPAPNLITNIATLAVAGTVQDHTATTVTVNGTVATRSGESWSASVALTEGANAIMVTAVDAAGNRTDSTRTVVLDTQAPVLLVDAPPDEFATRFDTVFVRGTTADANPVTVEVNGVPFPVDGSGAFSGSVSLAEGTNFITIVARDAAGNTTTVVRRGVRDTVAPALSVSEPAEGLATEEEQVTVSGTVTDATAVTLTVNGVPVTVGADGSFATAVELQVGDNSLLIAATDAAGNVTAVTRRVVRSEAATSRLTETLPIDSTLGAPELNRSAATPLVSATEFLYTGVNPVQTGVATGTIDGVRAAVLRGRVVTRAQTPLPSVEVSVVGHPEFGRTATRANGLFDMAVNGGAPLVVQYERDGYLSVQRQLRPDAQNYEIADDVVMIELDPIVTSVDFSAPVTVARGGVAADEAGPRQATVLFPQGTQASMVLPDGSTQPLPTISVRATEYTVGMSGPAAMPAPLPATSAYTYAVELSVDEAITAGATEVRFSQPVPFYVENFLKLPVGLAVPVASYDRVRGAWIPSDDGRVIKVLSVSGGVAELSVNKAGTPATESELTALGITGPELNSLAQLYQPGEMLWRARLAHFSPVDLNFPAVVPEDAEQPDASAKTKEDTPKDCNTDGSVIECGDQVLGEEIGIIGTPFSLNYRSDRVSGRAVSRDIAISLSGPTVPASVKRIELRVEIAGREFASAFPPEANQETTFRWDGLDAFGRAAQGAAIATVRVGYVYPLAYAVPPDIARSFGLSCVGDPAQPGREACLIDSTISPRAVQEYTLWEEWNAPLTSFDARELGLGGWSLTPHHLYDPIGEVVYRGDGGRQAFNRIRAVSSTFAGSDNYSEFWGDGGPAAAAMVRASDVVASPSGEFYMSEPSYGRIRKVDRNGIITTVIGTTTGFATHGYGGDGGPASQAILHTPSGLAMGPDGSLYIADASIHRIRRVTPDGIIRTVAGTGLTVYDGGFGGDGGPATSAKLNRPGGVAVAADGTVYIADSFNHRIRRVGADGVITTVAGTGVQGSSGDGDVATKARIEARDVALGPDGSLYTAGVYYGVRRITPDGFIHSVWSGPGVESVTVDEDGTVYFSDRKYSVVRRLGHDGSVTTVWGTGAWGFNGEGAPGPQTKLRWPMGILTVGRSLYVADYFTHRVRRLSSPHPGFDGKSIVLPSTDGAEVYVFDETGRHLRTADALTGALRYGFAYDASGFLSSVTDASGDVTTVERNAVGAAVAIVAPMGQRTALTVGSARYLDVVTNPAGERIELTYGPGGLLASFADSRRQLHRFSYDSVGRLVRDDDPAGGFKTLALTEDETRSVVAVATAMGRTTTYLNETSPGGSGKRTVTDPSGLNTTSMEGSDGITTTTTPDGTVTRVVQSPDPRFGMAAGFASQTTVSTPGGLRTAVLASRTVALVDTTNVFSLLEQLDSLAVNGRVSVSTYTGSTRTLGTVSAQGRTTTSRLDSLGRTVEVSVPGVLAVTSAYDDRGRLTRTAQGSLNWTYTYNAAGLLASVIDPISRSSQFVYDAAGRLTTQTFSDGRAVGYTYDANGNLLSVTPPGRSAHQFSYNASDLPESYTPPAVPGAEAPTLYSYNLDRQLTRTTRPDGSTLDFTYDQGGRLSVLSFPGGQLTYTYAATGNVSSIAALGGPTLSYTYDGSLARSVSWTGGAVSGRLSFVYDNDFRIVRDSVNGAHAVSYSYDRDGLLTAAGSLTLTRDAQNGRLTGTGLGVVASTAAYDSLGLASGTVVTAAGAEVFRTSYRRDALGRLVEVAEVVAGEAVTWTYGYDAAGRLSEVTRNGSAYASYEYDANGNRNRVVTAAGAVAASYDAQDRLVSRGMTTYSYTANGELSEKSVGGSATRTQYDALGNLRSTVLADGTNIDYVVDPLDRRVGRKVNGSLERGFLYSGALSPVAELDAVGNVVTRFIYGTRSNVPDYMVKGGVTYRLLTDHLGSVRLVVNASTGEVVQRLDYDPWGKVERNTNPGFQPFGFAGGLYDEATGLTRFGARDYDADAARWTAKDPIGFNGGDLNLYSYVSADPTNRSDPNGQFPWLAGAAVGGTLSGIESFAKGERGWRLVRSIAVGAGTGAIAFNLPLQKLLSSPQARAMISGAASGGFGNMSAQFLNNLGICDPDYSLKALGSAIFAGALGGAAGDAALTGWDDNWGKVAPVGESQAAAFSAWVAGLTDLAVRYVRPDAVPEGRR